jgi:hypothetical protein
LSSIWAAMTDPHNSGDEPVSPIDMPSPRLTSEQRAKRSWERIRAGGYISALQHLRPRFMERAPVQLYGQASDGWGSIYFLYRDACGRKRVLGAADHDRNGIAALFEGAEGWLCRLWPSPDGGWDDERAAETLMHFSACIGTVCAARLGFELPPVSVDRMASMLGVPASALLEDWPAANADD